MLLVRLPHFAYRRYQRLPLHKRKEKCRLMNKSMKTFCLNELLVLCNCTPLVKNQAAAKTLVKTNRGQLIFSSSPKLLFYLLKPFA